MRKGKTLIGKDVLSLAGGRKLHAVKDVIIGSDGTEIVALLVDEGGLLSSSRVVPIEYVESFGKDAVVISESRGVIPADQYPRVQSTLTRREKLVGKKVFTETGEDKGAIADMYFDEETGRILGFEVSGGAVSNLSRGTMYLPVEDIVRTGPDVVYIRPETAASLDEQKGGLQSALGSAKESAGGALDSAREKAGSAQSKPEDGLVGQQAPYDIEDDNGNVIVASGQRVSRDHVERLRTAGKLDAVLVQAGLKQPEQQGPGVGDQLSVAGAQASNVLGSAGDTAGSLWDQFTRKVQDMTDATGKRMDERQSKQLLNDIEDAVGRPVTKVLLDRQDNVILNLGDIITHQAVQRAHEAGALESLLKSVYKADVQFSREELMAPPTVEATATIEKATGDAPLVDELQTKLETAEQERQQQKEQSRIQSEADREQREQERQQRAQERETQAQQLQEQQAQQQQEREAQHQAQVQEAQATQSQWAEAQTEQAQPAQAIDTPSESWVPAPPPTAVTTGAPTGTLSATPSTLPEPTEYPDPLMQPEPAVVGYGDQGTSDLSVTQTTEISTQPADRSGPS